VRAALLLLVPVLGWAQNLQNVLKQGEQVFNKSCATGYCHGPKGIPAGAPRLAGRGFEQPYISAVTARGVTGTAMPAFAGSLSRPDLTAVVAYVAALNGIANPTIAPMGPLGPMAPTPPEQQLPAEAVRGRVLFYDAVRGFGRCATCHEINGVGISVTTPMVKLPADVAALRALTTPGVSTVTLAGEAMPALVVSKASRAVVFYDLTIPPPVQRTVDPAAVQIAEGSGWRHASVIGAYSDAELEAILVFLRAAVKP